jgi:hypothetical protein
MESAESPDALFIPAHSSPNGERPLAYAGIQHWVPAFAGTNGKERRSPNVST